jgi:hypothetical protein
MRKKEQKSKSKGKNPKKKRSAIGWLIAVSVGAILIVAFVFFTPKGEPWGLPANPDIPRPVTLSPALFTGEAARAYQIAQEVPELLERMPCYCGCYVNPGHRNNLDCYTDRHGAG